MIFLDVKDNIEARKQITELYFAEKPSLEKFRDKFTDEDGLLNFIIYLNNYLILPSVTYALLVELTKQLHSVTHQLISKRINWKKSGKKYATDFYNSLNVEEKDF